MSSAVLVGLVGCSQATSTTLPDDTVITYSFHDASVPPQYHRSFVITITKEETTIVVDSYGDVLAQQAVPTPTQVWNGWGEALPGVREEPGGSAAGGCVGGTSSGLKVVASTAVLADVSVDECGGGGPDAADRISSWIAPARSLFPAMDILAPEGE